MTNPFFYGNPIPTDFFLNRNRELRRTGSRIVNQGQSTAIIGEPRSGKTSVLHKLEDVTQGDAHLLFAHLDAQNFNGTLPEFRESALQPLYEKAVQPNPDSALAQAYHVCQANDFGAFVMERLLTHMQQDGWRLVLLLDEFDTLLHNQHLNPAEFFGSLRSLTTRSGGALVLVIASRQSLTQLNEATQAYSRTGSPYFNFFNEITLGPFPEPYVTKLLNQAGDQFQAADKRFIAALAGGHPYLLQVAASALWEAYADGEPDVQRRWRQAANDLYDEVALTLGDTWRLWSPASRQAMMLVALPQIEAALARPPATISTRRDSLHRLHSQLEGFPLEALYYLSYDTPDLVPVYDQLRSKVDRPTLIERLVVRATQSTDLEMLYVTVM